MYKNGYFKLETSSVFKLAWLCDYLTKDSRTCIDHHHSQLQIMTVT